MLRLVLPKGSLERATLELFDAADLAVHRGSDVDYRGTIDDPRVTDVRILRPQEIAGYVAEGLFDLGITGRDWIEETGSDVISLGELHYSKVTARPIQVVLAVAEDSPVRAAGDLPPGSRVSTEYPGLTGRYLAKHGVDAQVMLSYGATEAKVPEIADAVVEITETGPGPQGGGAAHRGHHLGVLHRAHRQPGRLPGPRQAPRHGAAAHPAAREPLEARGRVLVKLNVGADDLDAVIGLLPALKSPTVSKLFGGSAGDSGYAVETVVPKSEINRLIPALKDHGATGIIELPISKIVH